MRMKIGKYPSMIANSTPAVREITMPKPNEIDIRQIAALFSQIVGPLNTLAKVFENIS